MTERLSAAALVLDLVEMVKSRNARDYPEMPKDEQDAYLVGYLGAMLSRVVEDSPEVRRRVEMRHAFVSGCLLD
jgi:hypothetical protein